MKRPLKRREEKSTLKISIASPVKAYDRDLQRYEETWERAAHLTSYRQSRVQRVPLLNKGPRRTRPGMRLSRREHDSRTCSTEMPLIEHRESRADQPPLYEQPQGNPDLKIRRESSNSIRTTNRDTWSISSGDRWGRQGGASGGVRMRGREKQKEGEEK